MELIEIFETVKDHLLKQNCKSSNNNNICFYRGPNNTKCAVGCLIKDEFYSRGLEYKDADNGSVRAALKASGINADDELVLGLLMDLQKIHDQDYVADWPSILNNYKLCSN